jgi:hypothetical protein
MPVPIKAEGKQALHGQDLKYITALIDPRSGNYSNSKYYSLICLPPVGFENHLFCWLAEG